MRPWSYVKHNWQFLVALSAIALASLVLRGLIPPVAIYESPNDDGLMVHLANQILRTGWIRDWADTGTNTLSKGIGYPLYLAFSSRVFPWSPLVTNQLLLLLGGVVALRELRKLGLTRLMCLFSFVFVAFFPVWFSTPGSRIYRDGFLAVIVMLSIACSLVLRRSVVTLCRGELTWRPIVGAVIAGLATGLLVGYFFITKLGWQPLAVVVAVILLSGIVELSRVFTLRVATIFVAGFLAISVAIVSVVAYVSVRNERALGVGLVEDSGSGSFSQAVNNMMSVTDPSRPPYIDVSNATMTELFEVSPTLRRMQPFIEAPESSRAECDQLGICGQGPGQWLGWTLRSASERAGLATNAADFQHTFAKISREISLACDAGALTCGAPGIAPGLRALESLSPRLVLDAFGYGVNHILSLSASPAGGSFTAFDGELWNKVVHGLADPAATEREYNPNGAYIKGVTSALGTLYKAVWILLVILAAFGAVIPLRSGRTGSIDVLRARALRWLAVAGVAGAALVILQLALLEADGGLFLISGGNLYLIPTYPMVLLFLVAGLSRLGIWVRSRFARANHTGELASP